MSLLSFFRRPAPEPGPRQIEIEHLGQHLAAGLEDGMLIGYVDRGYGTMVSMGAMPDGRMFADLKFGGQEWTLTLRGPYVSLEMPDGKCHILHGGPAHG